jgi:hypothetical protein
MYLNFIDTEVLALVVVKGFVFLTVAAFVARFAWNRLS